MYLKWHNKMHLQHTVLGFNLEGKVKSLKRNMCDLRSVLALVQELTWKQSSVHFLVCEL